MEIFRALIGPDTGDATVAQLCFRAAILFAFGVLCIRIAGRRTFSQITPLDIIVALIIGSNISRAMTGKAPFFGGLAATLVVVVLHRLLAMATLHWSPRTWSKVCAWNRLNGSRTRAWPRSRLAARSASSRSSRRLADYAIGRRPTSGRPAIEVLRPLLTLTTFHERMLRRNRPRCEARATNSSIE
jgi:hypothetical protein